MREAFLERKKALDVRKGELACLVKEMEREAMVGDAGNREYGEAFGIREYAGLETFNKRVMASLISSAKVMGEDRLEVTWKYQDIYEKIFANVQP